MGMRSLRLLHPPAHPAGSGFSPLPQVLGWNQTPVDCRVAARGRPLARVRGTEGWRLGSCLFLEWGRREEEQAEGDGVLAGWPRRSKKTAPPVASWGILGPWLQVGKGDARARRSLSLVPALPISLSFPAQLCTSCPPFLSQNLPLQLNP